MITGRCSLCGVQVFRRRRDTEVRTQADGLLHRHSDPWRFEEAATRPVVIFRASDTPEVGAASHLPAEGTGPLIGNAPTVLRTLCGSVGIGRWFEREDATCALCVALAGRRPGKKGKAYLRRLTEEAPSGR